MPEILNQIYQCLLFTKIDNKISCQLMQFLDTNAKSTNIVLLLDVKTHTIINGWKYENEQFVGNIISQKLLPQKVANGRVGELIVTYGGIWGCTIVDVKMKAGVLVLVVDCPVVSGGSGGPSGGPMNPTPYPVIIPVVGSNPVSAGNIFGSGSPKGINVLLSSFKTLCNSMNAPLSAEEEAYLTGNSSLMISILSENNGNYLAPEPFRPNLGPLGNYIRNKYLDSDFEKNMLEQYWLGLGDYTLSYSQLEDIDYRGNPENGAQRIPCSFSIPSYSKIYEQQYTFYNDPVYNAALGRATLYFSSPTYIPIYSYDLVGFYDFYDFDSKPWGTRSLTNEIKTRGVRYFSPSTAKPFAIRYPDTFRR
jgi:hypothetical protein